jgi:hypothetical protein
MTMREPAGMPEGVPALPEGVGLRDMTPYASDRGPEEEIWSVLYRGRELGTVHQYRPGGGWYAHGADLTKPGHASREEAAREVYGRARRDGLLDAP